MLNVTPYILFNGNCTEAVNFYKTHLGGELFMVTYGEAPEQAHDYPVIIKDKIMHANLKRDNFNLMAGDTPTNEAKIGDNIQLYLNCESREEVEKLYKALSENGKKTVPLSDTFWGSYFGMLIDQFGIHWMLGFEIPK